MQSICLGVAVTVLTGLWLHQIVYSTDVDVTYLVIVSILVSAITAGFIFTFKSGDGK
jgi:hypothetical protein